MKRSRSKACFFFYFPKICYIYFLISLIGNSMWPRLLLTFLMVVSLLPATRAQNPTFRQLSIEDGLPSSEVYHVFQDSQGFIWFGTNMGVCRYDGENFEVFDLEDGLTDNTVFEIYEDFRGRIWFLTLSLRLSYYQGDSIVAYEHNDVLQEILKGKGHVYQKASFMVDSSETLYISLRGPGLYCIDKAGNVNRLTNRNPGDLEAYEYENRLLTPKSNEYDDIHNKLIIHKGDQSYEYQLDSFPKSLIHRAFGVKRGKRKMIYFDGRLMEMEGMDIRDYKIHPEVVWLSLDSSDRLWLGTPEGAIMYKGFSLNSQTKRYLRNYTITSVLQDHEGGLWFTTLHHGIFYAPNSNIETYTTEDGLASNNIIELDSDSSGNMWLGYSEPMLGKFRNHPLKTYSVPGGIGEEGISCMYYDYYFDRLWLGRWDYLLYMDLGKSNPKVIPSSYQAQTKSIFSREERMWIGSTHNIHFLRNNEVYFSAAQKYQFRHRVEALYYKGDTLFAGTLRGLWAYSDEAFQHLGSENDLLYHRITDMQSSGKCLLLGTRGAGLLLRKDGKIYQITQRDGLVSNSIKSISTGAGYVWVATNRGVSRLTIENIEKQQYDIFNLSSHNGLPSPEINDIEVKDSLLYVATNKGLSCFNIHQVQPNTHRPEVYIKNMKINEKDTLVRDTYHLDYDQNFLTLEYKGLSYRKAGALNYQYRMLGLDTTWKHTTQRVKSYTTLPPGSYTFQLKASNEDGYWTGEPLSIRFVIDKPFWRTWWFISLVVLLGIVLIWIVVHFRLRTIRRRRELLQDINEYKQKMLRQQMNPHFIFNTLNSIQYFLLDDDTTSSLTYLSKFAKLMRIVLDNSQHNFISIEDEIQGVRLYLELEALRFEESFDYEIVIDPQVNTYEYKMPALLLQPYVENSIRHGLLHKKGKGHLLVQITKEESALFCVIEDNGIGRRKAAEIKMKQGTFQQSLGSKITEDRIDILNSLYSNDIDIRYVDLEDEMGQPRGTRVEITLPFVF
jgi:ligand-binding sensor domain-containing protein